ncbi:NADH dehydrogenase-like protein [Lactococcus lactis]|nr:NADH dehydrogenase-like protein [Lactococcus lactis]
MAKKKIVIVGAGFAGVSATRLLAKNLKNDAEITVIDKHDFQTSMTQLHEVAASRVEADAVQYHLERTIGKFHNVNVVKKSLVELDKANKKVITEKGSYDYDYLVCQWVENPMILEFQVLKNMDLHFGHLKML